jgi:hypothetical protein
MDRKISRQIDSKLINIDSAFRRRNENTHDYHVYFDSLNKGRSRIVKDVIGLRVNKACIPAVHDNIMSGINILNLHIISLTDNVVSKTLKSELDLIQYLGVLSEDLVLTKENHISETSENEIAAPALLPMLMTKKKNHPIYKISSKSGNQVLTSSENFPNATLFQENGKNMYAMLVSSSYKTWNIILPITLKLSVCESHRILLKPGYYPTASLFISELFDAFGELQSGVDSGIQHYYDWNDSANTDSANTDSQPTLYGWSMFSDAKGKWTLYFKPSNNDNKDIYFSREPGEYDILYQMGLRDNEITNWANPVPSQRENNELFKMKKHLLPSYIFELNFEKINLSPRRYIDILIKNIPNSSYITNGTYHNNVFARVNFANQNISYTSNKSISNEFNLLNTFDEASSAETYIIYENTNTTKIPFFDPISLDHLQIQLLDNMGYPYSAEKNHTIELEITVLGDANVHFDFPVNNIGSFSQPRRSLLGEYPDRKERKRRKKIENTTQETEEIKHQHIFTNWIIDNKIELGTFTLTFFAVLYASYRALHKIEPGRTL